jgi:hypothetical protein
MIGLTPDITEAAVIRHGVLHLRFVDGVSGEVPGGADLAPETLYERIRTGAWRDQASPILAHVGRREGPARYRVGASATARIAAGLPGGQPGSGSIVSS